MTTSDLSGCCKPFGVSKSIALDVYEEFYNQVNIFEQIVNDRSSKNSC